MVVYTLEQRWEIWQHCLENHGNVAECVRKLRTAFEWKSGKSDRNLHPPKQRVHSRILLLRQKVCVKRHQHQFTVVLNNWTFRRHRRDEFCMKILVWRHTKFSLFRSWSQLTIQWIFASLNGPANFGKKIIFTNPKSDIKMKIWKYFFGKFLAKTLRVNKMPRKVSQQICRSKLTLNCRSRHLCTKFTHTTRL